MNKAYRYRIYPTKEQKIMFAKTFGCVRFIYNKMLGDHLNYCKETGKINEQSEIIGKNSRQQNQAAQNRLGEALPAQTANGKQHHKNRDHK